MFVNSDFSDLLKLFNENNVKYLVIGGYAFIQYAEPRYTKDTVSSFWKISSLASVIRAGADITALILCTPFTRLQLESVRPKGRNRCQWHIFLPNLFSAGFKDDLA